MTASRESAVREEICQIGASLYQRGYTVGTAGNISARLDDGWLITPTDACLGRLDPATLSKVDAGGAWVNGARPSKTLALHRAIYENSPRSQAVVHTHSTHLVALTLAGVWQMDDVLPPITPYFVMKVGHVPLLAYHPPGAPEVVEQVRAWAARVNAVLLERLGPVVWGTSVSHASWALEELEETARLWLLNSRKPAPLTPEQLDDLRQMFGVQW
jgi:ribulose-5-phosphate 4-epimerase/fuculose-1-phosphate aldolase